MMSNGIIVTSIEGQEILHMPMDLIQNMKRFDISDAAIRTLDRLGIWNPGDLQLIRDVDLDPIGLPIIQKRKLIIALNQTASLYGFSLPIAETSPATILNTQHQQQQQQPTQTNSNMGTYVYNPAMQQSFQSNASNSSPNSSLGLTSPATWITQPNNSTMINGTIPSNLTVLPTSSLVAGKAIDYTQPPTMMVPPPTLIQTPQTQQPTMFIPNTIPLQHQPTTMVLPTISNQNHTTFNNSKPALSESNNERNFNSSNIPTFDDEDEDTLLATSISSINLSTRNQNGSLPPVDPIDSGNYLMKQSGSSELGLSNVSTSSSSSNNSSNSSFPSNNGVSVLPFSKSSQYEQQQKKEQEEKQVCKYFLDGHCGRGDKCRFAHPGASTNLKTSKEAPPKYPVATDSKFVPTMTTLVPTHSAAPSYSSMAKKPAAPQPPITSAPQPSTKTNSSVHNNTTHPSSGSFYIPNTNNSNSHNNNNYNYGHNNNNNINSSSITNAKTKDDSKPKPKEGKHIGKWFWRDDHKNWIAFTDEVNKRLEQAWNTVGTNIVPIDSQRFVNIKLMEQIRYDDTSRRREVNRENVVV